MAHTPQHARKPHNSNFGTSEKILAAVLALAVIGIVAYIWLASITHGGAPVATGVINHALNPVAHPTTRPSTSPAAPVAAGSVIAGVIAGIVKKLTFKHVIVKHVIAKHYIVRPGDTLWGIAKTALHNPLKWHQLYTLNHAVIGADPNKIVAGQSLLLLLGEPYRPMARIT